MSFKFKMFLYFLNEPLKLLDMSNMRILRSYYLFFGLVIKYGQAILNAVINSYLWGAYADSIRYEKRYTL